MVCTRGWRASSSATRTTSGPQSPNTTGRYVYSRMGLLTSFNQSPGHSRRFSTRQPCCSLHHGQLLHQDFDAERLLSSSSSQQGLWSQVMPSCIWHLLAPHLATTVKPDHNHNPNLIPLPHHRPFTTPRRPSKRPATSKRPHAAQLSPHQKK